MTVFAIFICTIYASGAQFNSCSPIGASYRDGGECKRFADRLNGSLPRGGNLTLKYACMSKDVPAWQPVR